MKKSIPALLLLLFLFNALPFAAAQNNTKHKYTDIVRICLAFKSKKPVVLQMKGRVELWDMDSNTRRKLKGSGTLKISKSEQNGGLLIGKFETGKNAKIIFTDETERLVYNGIDYGGDISVRLESDNSVTVIEEIQLEEYLYGVLPKEMNYQWPMEALKAQAVAARTYALKNINQFEAEGFDLHSDVRDQAYIGRSQAHPRIIEAVDATKGQVLAYKGTLLSAFYHANCGGQTSQPIWGKQTSTIPPLSGVKCGMCGWSKNKSWSRSITEKDALEFIRARAKTKKRITKINNIKITRRNKASRALTLQFQTNAGNFSVNANDFRLTYTQLKSTYFTNILKSKNRFVFQGRGYGHGVGMCQEGAKQMAQKKSKYRDILKKYYPNASVITWDKL